MLAVEVKKEVYFYDRALKQHLPSPRVLQMKGLGHVRGVQACKFFRFSLNSDFFYSIALRFFFISLRLFSEDAFTPLGVGGGQRQG